MNLSEITNGDSKLFSFPPAESLFRDKSKKNNEYEQPVEFTYTLAHEIRNPLSTINLTVEMLKITNDQQQKEAYLDIIARNSLRINDLLTKLLASYQLDGIKSEKYSINQLMDEVLFMIRDRLLLKNIKVSKYYSTQDCKISLNIEKIKIALTNIIINAVEAMPLEKPQLRLVTKLINGKCVVEIEDNGSGISKENMKRIFTPYFTTKPGGIGLGLSSSLDILRANHFHVELQSEEGVGTRFILSFDNVPEIDQIYK
jgi:signal transduction histidine kinase